MRRNNLKMRHNQPSIGTCPSAFSRPLLRGARHERAVPTLFKAQGESACHHHVTDASRGRRGEDSMPPTLFGRTKVSEGVTLANLYQSHSLANSR